MNRICWIKSLSACCVVGAALVATLQPRRAAAQPQLQGSGLSADTNLPQRAQDYASDQAKYNAAKRSYDDSTAQIVAARQAAGQAYRSSPEYLAAQKAVDDTFKAYNDRKKEVMSGGAQQNDPKYIELTKQAAAVDQQIAAARQNPGTSFQQFQDLYNQKAVYTKQLKSINDDAMSQAGTDDLKRAWNEASAHLRALQADQQKAVEQSGQVQVAIAAAAQAKAELDQEGIALAGSQAAYNHAADLQAQQDEYMRRYPPSNYDPYSWWGDYGGAGYWGGWGYHWPVVGVGAGLR